MTKELREQGAQGAPPRPSPQPTPDATDRDAPHPGADRVTRDTIKEIGGPSGPDPTRYGDWERRGRCIDF